MKHWSWLKQENWCRLALCLLTCALTFVFSTPTRAQQGTGTKLTLEALGYQERSLNWLTNETYYWFGLPTHWEAADGSYLHLELAYSISGEQDYAPALLEIHFNNEILHTESFKSPAEFNVEIAIPTDLLRDFETTVLNELYIKLEIYGECEENLLTTLMIRPSSYFLINHTERPLSLDLSNYPYPLYQRRAITETQARFVLPTAPGTSDMQAALMVATKLGELTNHNLPFTSSLASDLPLTSTLNDHLIIIGGPDTQPLIPQLELPIPLVERQLNLRSGMPSRVVAGQIFSYTLWVENTSPTAKALFIKDVWSPGVTLTQYPSMCQVLQSGILQCQLGNVQPGASISTTIQARKDRPAFGGYIEHTASLFDIAGQILNVDTLQASLGLVSSQQWITSSMEKGTYFFTNDGYGVSETDGLVLMTLSPWSDKYAALVVTGLNDAALLKAALALATDTAFPGMSGASALIQTVNPMQTSQTSELEKDITLESLGYEDQVLGAFANSIQYNFYIPRGWFLVEGARLMLHSSHSAALNAMSATLEVQVNQIPISSIPLSDSNMDNTWHTLTIDTDHLRSGTNRLAFELSADMPQCLDSGTSAGLWLTLYADTQIQVPHGRITATFDLDDFPRPFSQQQDLSDVVFVLPDEIQASILAGTLNLASFLGSAAGGHVTHPRVVFGRDFESADWTNYHIIAIGRPTRNAFIKTINDKLPQPFLPGSDQIVQVIDPVIYRLPTDYNLGIIQTLRSLWQEERALLIVTGTTDKGIIWALDALSNDDFLYRLDGDLVTIPAAMEIRVTDTRDKLPQPLQSPLPTPTPPASPAPELTATPTATSYPTSTPVKTPLSDVTPTPIPTMTDKSKSTIQERPFWLAPLLVLSLLSVIVTVGLAIRQARS